MGNLNHCLLILLFGIHLSVSTLSDGSRIELDSGSVSGPSNGTLIATTIAVEPFLRLKEDAHARVGNDRYEGYIPDLTAALADVTGFNFELRMVADNAYGSPNSRGKWNGMVGEIMNGQADVTIAPLTITAYRSKFVDFTSPFMSLGISMMIYRPYYIREEGIGTYFVPLDMVSYEVLFCLGLAFVGIFVALFVVARLSPYERLDVKDGLNSQLPVANETSMLKAILNDVSNSCCFLFGSFLHQDVGIRPRSVSGRILRAVWWFFVFIAVSAYIAHLIAHFAAIAASGGWRHRLPYDSVEDLVNSGDVKYGTLRRGSTAQFFQMSKYHLYQHMWTGMVSAEPSVFAESLDEGIRRVRESHGRYAFLLESTMNDYINSRKPCNTMRLGQNFDLKYYGIAIAKGSHFKDSLNLAVSKLREMGVLNSLYKKWWIEMGECEDPDNFSQTGQTLTLPQLITVFYILIGGLLLAMFVCLCEFLWFRLLEKCRPGSQNVGRRET